MLQKSKEVSNSSIPFSVDVTELLTCHTFYRSEKKKGNRYRAFQKSPVIIKGDNPTVFKMITLFSVRYVFK